MFLKQHQKSIRILIGIRLLYKDEWAVWCPENVVHGRPTWRDRFSNLNQAPFPGPWNHAEVKATSQIAPRVVQKAPLLIRSGKYLICVCEGVVLRQCALIIRMRVVWRWEPFDARWTCICEVALHFVSDALHMTPACSWWLDYHAHIYVYSLLFWQDCVYSIALPIDVYIRQSAMDALVGSVIFIVRPDGLRVSIGAHWIWTGVEWEKLVSIWKYLSWCIRHLHVHGDWITMSLQTPDIASMWDPRNSSRRYRSGGTAKCGITTIPCLTRQWTWQCFRVRKYAITIGGTAKRGNSHDSRLQADHFTCKFIGAGPHTPFGIIIIYQGVRWCFGGCEDFSEDVLST